MHASAPTTPTGTPHAAAPLNLGTAPEQRRRPASAQAPHGDHATARQLNPHHVRILMIDDEELNLEVIRELLCLEGYQNFQLSTDPVQALQQLEEEVYDLILLDIQMPVMNGLEVLRSIRSNPRLSTLPIIILTANSDDDTKLAALDLGATDFLRKPVHRGELAARIRNVLTVKAHQDYLEDHSSMLEQAVRQRTRQLEETRLEVIHCLARAAEFRDDDTGNHVRRVGRYARLIGQQLGLETEYLDTLELAAQLHDIGKIGIPDDILLKPGRLTDEQFEFMQRHSAFGKKIVTPMSSHESQLVRGHVQIGGKILGSVQSPFLQMACRIALTHHEKWDGSGYPLGLAGTDIPLEGRITAVADVFDALSCKRPYKPAFPLEKCFSILRDGRGSHFDPDCIDAFFDITDRIIETQIEFADEA
ncbi:response regulator [Roseiconus nitratireducens]|uniref:Response regulator n=1 Tax=Roseiconus nitratireducens TaxID=2605748 RepID=A0A5M6DH10_9BACT|nr:HD domain-containing phosphohydrolase [Roseiconus nitratireducens]KAA5545542.1 response regulator [Roseiconus nitratireducens]